MTDDQLRKALVAAAGGQTKGPLGIDVLRRFAQTIAADERAECLAAMGTLHDSIVARAIVESDSSVQTIMRHVAEAGVGSAITLIENRGKK